MSNFQEELGFFDPFTGQRFTFLQEDFDKLPENARLFMRYLANNSSKELIECRKQLAKEIKYSNILRQDLDELERDLMESEYESCKLAYGKSERCVRAFERLVDHFLGARQKKKLLKSENTPTTF